MYVWGRGCLSEVLLCVGWVGVGVSFWGVAICLSFIYDVVNILLFQCCFVCIAINYNWIITGVGISAAITVWIVDVKVSPCVNIIVPDMEALALAGHFPVLSRSTESALEEGKRDVFLPQPHPSSVVFFFFLSSRASTSGMLKFLVVRVSCYMKMT